MLNVVKIHARVEKTSHAHIQIIYMEMYMSVT